MKKLLSFKIPLIIGSILLIYLLGCVYFHFHYLPRTYIGDLSVGGKSVKGLEKAMNKLVDKYRLHLYPDLTGV